MDLRIKIQINAIQTKLPSPFECCIWEIFTSITSLKTSFKTIFVKFLKTFLHKCQDVWCSWIYNLTYHEIFISLFIFKCVCVCMLKILLLYSFPCRHTVSKYQLKILSSWYYISSWMYIHLCISRFSTVPLVYILFLCPNYNVLFSISLQIDFKMLHENYLFLLKITLTICDLVLLVESAE